MAAGKTNVLAETLVLRVLAIVVALFLFGIFVFFAKSNPIEVFKLMYNGSFGSWFSIKDTLERAAPLILTALCVALPARLGMVVIGAEGALVVGGLAAAAVAIPLQESSPMTILTAMALCGIFAGGIWIMLVGALRHYRGVNETICSLLLNYIAIALLNHFVEGPLRDPQSLNKPSTLPIGDDNMLGKMPWLDVHWGLAYGVGFCLLAYFVLQHTTTGFSIRTTGGNVRAAKIVGLPVGLLTLGTCFAAGAAAGLAGMVEVAAVQGAANASIVCGYGYAGILVSFIARHNPLGIIPVAILLSGINASSGMLQRYAHMPDATVTVLQGILFVVILASETLYGRFDIFKSKVVADKPKSAPPALPAGLQGAAHG
jgi:ABC-type uncharacterized transport system permease subunit